MPPPPGVTAAALLRTALEVICLTLAAALPHNDHLVYALLHGRQLVEDCVAFGEELMSHCSAVVKYFGTRVDTEMKEKNGVWTEDDVMQILGRSVGLTGGCGFLPPLLTRSIVVCSCCQPHVARPVWRGCSHHGTAGQV